MEIKAWQKIQEILDPDFKVEDASKDEVQVKKNLHVDSFQQFPPNYYWGYINDIPTETFSSTIQEYQNSYEKELEHFLLEDRKTVQRVLQQRNYLIKECIEEMLPSQLYHKNHPYKKTGTTKIFNEDRMIHIDKYDNPKNKILSDAFEQFSDFLHWLNEQHNYILAQFDLLTSANQDYFKYTGTDDLKEPYKLLVNHGYLDDHQCSFGAFQKLFTRGPQGFKADWQKTQASFKYFINQITQKESKISSRNKWIKASHCFTIKGRLYSNKGMADLQSKTIDDLNVLDQIGQHFTK